MQRCKESKPSRAGLPTQQRKGKLLPGKAIWGRRLQGQAPRKLCQEKKKLADGKHRLKKKKKTKNPEAQSKGMADLGAHWQTEGTGFLNTGD